jgi:hypothetical protein
MRVGMFIFRKGCSKSDGVAIGFKKNGTAEEASPVAELKDESDYREAYWAPGVVSWIPMASPETTNWTRRF